ncbi:hypothetical protein JCM19294_1129 [Nonlabens tegetincola]|uniref:Uncharacterized protein n=1 Tax=Nonlabens tegetincola TaxID=323273 RepID=A0A090Q1A7_9FLAO|nr:hypothetical protein [Nonlabens tegetincola]GAK96820.1 hypothetical protein JCM19294_1129 [Nonlabens tegetincola]
MSVHDLMESLNEEDFETIEYMASLNAGPRDIARKLAVDLRSFMIAWNTPDNAVRIAYFKGVKEIEMVKDAALLDRVRDGNVTAMQIVDKARKEQDFQDIKRQVFGLDT